MKDKRVMSYRHHVIWSDGWSYMFAKGDGTDYHFDTITAAMNKIDEIEDSKERKKS